MTRARLKAVHPVLPTRDVRASISFYVDRLGFTLLGQDSPTDPRYAAKIAAIANGPTIDRAVAAVSQAMGQVAGAAGSLANSFASNTGIGNLR